MEETRSINDLQHPAWNPRTISDHDFRSLVNSIKEFGDLSGVVKNIATSNLIGGNQRIEAFKTLSADRIVISQYMSDGPTRTGTVAHGYVLTPDGEQYSYREVLWPTDAQDENGQPYSSKEKAANIVANRATGQWDHDLLAQVTFDLSQLENGDDLLALTGQTDDEIDALLRSVGSEPNPEPNEPSGSNDDGFQRLTVRLTDEQYATIYQAIGLMKHSRTLTNEPNSDLDANALYYIAKHYVEATSHNIEPPTGPADIPSEPTDLSSLPAEPAAA